MYEKMFVSVILLIVMPLSSFGNGQREAPKNKQGVNNNKTQNIVQVLEELPDWDTARTNDNKKKFLNIALKLSREKSEYLQSAIDFYLNEVRGEFPRFYKRAVKMFILNRLIFNVPSSPVPYERVFDSFGGIPASTTSDHKINWLWPLSETNKGRIELTGRIMSFRGIYGALEEFTFFEKEFGRRKLHKLIQDSTK